MSGSSYKHKSGATKRKEREKRAQEKTKLKKLDTYFVRSNPGDEPDIVESESTPQNVAVRSGSQIYRYNFSQSLTLKTICELVVKC